MESFFKTLWLMSLVTLSRCQTISFEERWITQGPVEKEFPHAILIMTSNQADEEFCSGSLLSERWVLTAARCMYRGNKVVENDTSLTLYAGVVQCVDLNSTVVQKRQSQKLRIFEEPSGDNFYSLALVKAKDDFEISTAERELNVRFISVNEYGFTKVQVDAGKSGSFGGISWDSKFMNNKIKKLEHQVTRCSKSCGKELKDAFPKVDMKKWLCGHAIISSVGVCKGDFGLGLMCDQGLQAVSVGLVKFEDAESCKLEEKETKECGKLGNVEIFVDTCWYLEWINERVPSVPYDSQTVCDAPSHCGRIEIGLLCFCFVFVPVIKHLYY